MSTVPQPADVSNLVHVADLTPKEVLKRGKQIAAKLKSLNESYPNVFACTIDGNPYPKVEAYQFVAACYQCTPQVTSTQEILSGQIGSLEIPESQGFLAAAVLLDAKGMVVSGAESDCMRSEPEWATKPSFQLRSMAETRVCGKVCRNLFAWIMPLAGLSPTPAEEMIGAGFQSTARAPRKNAKTDKQCSNCSNRISAALYRQTMKIYNKPLCMECRKSEQEPPHEPFAHAVSDASQVPSTVTSIQAGKKQPIADVLDAMPRDEKAYSI